MKFTEQTELGPQGNCLSACVATIFEIPLSEIPNFNQFGEAWYRSFIDWCLERQIGLVYMTAQDSRAGAYSNMIIIAVYEVLNNPSVLHAVVAKRDLKLKEGIKNWIWETAVVFDPSPEPVTFGPLKFVLIPQRLSC